MTLSTNLLRRFVPASALLTLVAAASAQTGSGSIPGPACPGNIVLNGGFHLGMTPGSMPAATSANWQTLSASPQVVHNQGNLGLGCMQMWGNLAVGESIRQLLPGTGFVAGQTYQISFAYRWLNNNPNLPQNVAFRLCATAAGPTGYPVTGGYTVVAQTPLTTSTSWIYHTSQFTPTANASWLTINPENQFAVNDGNFVSWGQIDDLCIRNVSSCPNSVVTNGSFTAGLVPGSMPSASVTAWNPLSNTPQVVATQGNAAPGCIQMWGNQAVGESVSQTLPGSGLIAGRTYRVSFAYRWLDNNPLLPQYVQFRIAASPGLTGYPATSGYQVVTITPPTSSTVWVAHSVLFTPSTNLQYLTINPENAFALNDGNYVSWGQVDDVCVQDVTRPGILYDLGTGCVGLHLGSVTPPVLGTVFESTTDSIPAGAVVGAHLLSFVSHQPGIDLTGLGLPGCFQYAGTESVAFFVVGGPTVSHQLALPADTAFTGVPLTQQSLVFVPGVNPLGAATSNGLCLVIGDH